MKSYQRGYNARPVDIKYSSFHENYHNKEGKLRRLRHQRNDVWDLKVEASEFDGNINPKKNLDWVQSLEIIFELKYYNYDKAFKLAILKMKGYASL